MINHIILISNKIINFNQKIQTLTKTVRVEQEWFLELMMIRIKVVIHSYQVKIILIIGFMMNNKTTNYNPN